MVGDGVNDAPALAQATSASPSARNRRGDRGGEIVLMKSNPLAVLNAIILSKATVRKMKQNLWWASIYNLLASGRGRCFLSAVGRSLRPEVPPCSCPPRQSSWPSMAVMLQPFGWAFAFDRIETSRSTTALRAQQGG